jgi:transposase
MLGPPKSRCLDRSVIVFLEALVPTDHFYRHLEGLLDLSFIRKWVADLYAAGGRPSIDPVIFFKLQLLMFFEGRPASGYPAGSAGWSRRPRSTWHTAGRPLRGTRWNDKPLPDHSSLTRIRQRLGLALFRRFFDHIVELCDDAGLIWGKELLVDATKVRGNASIESLVPRLKEVVDEHLVELFGDDEEEAEQVTSPEAAPPLLHPPAAPAGDVDSEPSAKRWDLLDTCRLDPDRPLSQGYKRLLHRKISRTDPDATPMAMADQRSVLGYQTQYMIDGGTAHIILHALTMSGDIMENQPFLDQLRRVLFRWKLHPERVIADTKYSTIENIKALDAMEINAYMPLRDWEHKTEYFGASHFTYDPNQDVYRCLQVELLNRSRTEWKAEKWEYQADAVTCNACPLKAKCTPSDQGRQLHRSFHAAAMERVKGHEGTQAYRKAMRKRKVWIEPLCAEAKQWHGPDRFRVRRLGRVNIQTLLIASGQNLKRYLAARGWGRRPGPSGSRWASFRPCLTVTSRI